MILITGASGNIGRELIRRLSEAGTPYRAGLHSPGKAAELKLPANSSAVEFDFTRPETMRAAMAGIERLFLLSPSGPEMAEREIEAVELAGEAGVRHVVKLSAFGAQTDGFMLGRLHRESEKHVLASGLAYTFLRPNTFMQNLVFLCADSVRAEGRIYLPCGDTDISHVDSRNVAEIAQRVLRDDAHFKRIYEITGPESLTCTEIARRVSTVTGRNVSYVDIPPEKFHARLAAMGLPGWMVEAMVDLLAFQAEGFTSAVSPAYEHVMGKAPTSFNKWMRDAAGAFA